MGPKRVAFGVTLLHGVLTLAGEGLQREGGAAQPPPPPPPPPPTPGVSSRYPVALYM